MKPTDEQLKQLLREQEEIEQRPLTERDIEAYSLLLESMNHERKTQTDTSVAVVDAVMAEIALLEERKDRRRDAITLVSAVCVGLLATAICYYFVDYALLTAGLSWLKAHAPVVAFIIIAVGIIQFADKKLISRN
ncbi:hypothetical protein [Parapedobacter sp. DT-150]|uniref:hypothetical protein n=1 Tax=Parapedobacter sp. DT-150 TaxID=3396162 RepID=UPI003F1B0FF3